VWPIFSNLLIIEVFPVPGPPVITIFITMFFVKFDNNV